MLGMAGIAVIVKQLVEILGRFLLMPVFCVVTFVSSGVTCPGVQKTGVYVFLKIGREH